MATNGNRSRFGDRLKKIAWFRRRRKKEVNNVPIHVAKVLAAIPGMVYDSLNEEVELQKETSNVENKPKRFKIISKKPAFIKQITKKPIEQNIKKENIVINKEQKIRKKAIVGNIDIEKIKEKQEEFFKKMIPVYGTKEVTSEVKETVPVEQNTRVKELEKQIINIIKKNLIKTVNELEILYSELYLLSEVNGKSKVLTECEEELKQVRKMIEQIDKLKEQYNYLKDNYDFEYLLEIEDKQLVDKIIELKNSFDNNEVRAVVADYKLLDVYKYLYLKIDDLEEKTAKFQEEKKIEEEKLRKRDIKFEELKKNVQSVDRVKEKYDNFVRSQKEIIDDLNAKIGKISSHEETNYRLEGANKLFLNTFKYFGLLMLSPLKGLIPTIAASTLATRSMIKTLYNQVTVTEERKIVYETTNYNHLLSGVYDDLESTDSMIDESLYDIARLKQRYKEEFQEYQNDFTEYKEIIAKINDMENQIIGNKIKIEIMKKRTKEQQKENAKTLRLVDEYNRDSKNTMQKAA